MKKSLILLWITLFAFFTFGCGSDDDTAAVNQSGLALNQMSAAMGSIASMSFVASALKSENLNTMAGVPTDYCSAVGKPKISGSDMTDADEEIAAGTGFCQSTFNALSPDTARGAMYIAGGVACEAAYAGALDGLTSGESNSSTVDMNITTRCWGSQAEVDAMIADIGSSSINNVSLVVEDVSGSSDFNYKVTFTFPSESAQVIYIKNENGIKAALFATASPWYVKMDENDGDLIYEGIDTDNQRRVRLLIEGTISGTSFSSISSIKGFWIQASSGTWSQYATYIGTPSLGLLGNFGSNGGTDHSNECYWPAISATCSGLSSIAMTDPNAVSQISDRTTSATALAASTTTLPDFSNIDPADTDITQ